MDIDYTKSEVYSKFNLGKRFLENNPSVYNHFIYDNMVYTNHPDFICPTLRGFLDISSRDIVFHKPKRIEEIEKEVGKEGFTYKGYRYFHVRLDSSFKLNITPIEKLSMENAPPAFSPGDTCPICLLEFDENTEIRQVECCKKLFCNICIAQHLCQSPNSKCPCCRGSGKTAEPVTHWKIVE